MSRIAVVALLGVFFYVVVPGVFVLFPADFFDSLFGFLQYSSAMVDEFHSLFVLSEAILERDSALLDLGDNFGKLFYCVFEG
jgi:hypothetical protein